MTGHNRIVIEAGSKKAFASAIDWPGWSRAGKTEEVALDVLAAYADRYQKVVDLAGVPGVSSATDVEIVEQLSGDATTDFGAPNVAAAVERERMSDVECERQLALVRACWSCFDDVASRVSAELQKGPRGGGRDRAKMVAHTWEAERSYARQIGVKTPKGTMDTIEGLRHHRDAVCDAIRSINAVGGSGRTWPLRYFIRRMSWHVLDHAWEMEDKDLTGAS